MFHLLTWESQVTVDESVRLNTCSYNNSNGQGAMYQKPQETCTMSDPAVNIRVIQLNESPRKCIPNKQHVHQYVCG